MDAFQSHQLDDTFLPFCTIFVTHNLPLQARAKLHKSHINSFYPNILSITLVFALGLTNMISIHYPSFLLPAQP